MCPLQNAIGRFAQTANIPYYDPRQEGSASGVEFTPLNTSLLKVALITAYLTPAGIISTAKYDGGPGLHKVRTKWQVPIP